MCVCVCAVGVEREMSPSLQPLSWALLSYEPSRRKAHRASTSNGPISATFLTDWILSHGLSGVPAVTHTRTLQSGELLGEVIFHYDKTTKKRKNEREKRKRRGRRSDESRAYSTSKSLRSASSASSSSRSTVWEDAKELQDEIRVRSSVTWSGEWPLT